MDAMVKEKKTFEWTLRLVSTLILDGKTGGMTDGWTENQTFISHLAKAGATINHHHTMCKDKEP